MHVEAQPKEKTNIKSRNEHKLAPFHIRTSYTALATKGALSSRAVFSENTLTYNRGY
jgi:hypothetical protein